MGYFKPEILLTSPGGAAKHTIDFSTCTAKDLELCEFPFQWTVTKTELMHGFACWFDVKFFGSDTVVCLTTSPRADGTHWYQSRLLFHEPIAVNKGQTLSGRLRMKANEHSSFAVSLTCTLDGCGVAAGCKIDLHDQHYEYLQKAFE